MELRATILGPFVSLLSIVGCATTGGDNLQQESARAIGGNVSPNQIVVSGVDQDATSVRWKAKTPGGDYDCSADWYFGHPTFVSRGNCVKK